MTLVCTARRPLPWHEAATVTDFDRDHGYEPPEELLHRQYASLEHLLAACPLEAWPRKWRRGAWPGPGDVRVRRIFWLAQRDGLQCRYCQVPLCPCEATIDHRVPGSRGGSNAPVNLCLACLSCNSRKGTMTDAEYLGVAAA
jgi:HNH endonuclease